MASTSIDHSLVVGLLPVWRLGWWLGQWPGPFWQIALARWWRGIAPSAVRVGEDPLALLIRSTDVLGDGQAVLMDIGVVIPTQQNGILGAGRALVVPPDAVVNLPQPRWGAAAGVLAS